MLNNKQKIAYDLIVNEKHNVFITGPGGCGKTYLIKHLKNQEETLSLNIAVTALTGIAATLIGGMTLHSWAGIGNPNKSKDAILKDIKKKDDIVKRWNETDLLIVDEISMMPIELFHTLNYLGQKIRGCEDKFMGGLQILFSGDFCQLPPASNFSRFIFESKYWCENFNSENTVYFKEVIRQKDPTLQRVLNEVRLGQISSETRSVLSSRLLKNLQTEDGYIDPFEEEINRMVPAVKPTILFPYNKNVDEINSKELEKLILEENRENHMYKSEDTFIDWRDKKRELRNSELKQLNKLVDDTCRGLRDLTLAVGAQVILTVNLDVEKDLVNGSRGVITKFEEICDAEGEFTHYPVVKFDTGNSSEELRIAPFSWKIDHPKYNIYRKQFPLILGWAISIHKGQGSTLSLMITDLREVFSSGQAYVALSRVKSLEGLYLQGISFAKIKCDRRVRDYYLGL